MMLHQSETAYQPGKSAFKILFQSHTKLLSSLIKPKSWQSCEFELTTVLTICEISLQIIAHQQGADFFKLAIVWHRARRYECTIWTEVVILVSLTLSPFTQEIRFTIICRSYEKTVTKKISRKL